MALAGCNFCGAGFPLWQCADEMAGIETLIEAALRGAGADGEGRAVVMVGTSAPLLLSESRPPRIAPHTQPAVHRHTTSTAARAGGAAGRGGGGERIHGRHAIAYVARRHRQGPALLILTRFPSFSRRGSGSTCLSLLLACTISVAPAAGTHVAFCALHGDGGGDGV